MKIYEVVTGCYEDYGVMARFDNILDAERYCAENNSEELDFEDPYCEEYSIHEVELDDPIPEKNKIYYALIYKTNGPNSYTKFECARYRISNRPVSAAIHYDDFGDVYVSLPINRLDDISDEHLCEVAREEYAKYKDIKEA